MSGDPGRGGLIRGTLLRRIPFSDTADAQDVYGNLPVLQELNCLFQLGFISVRDGKRGVGCEESMVVNLAFDVARISAVNQRHVAIRAPSGFRRVVERPRSLTGNAACLPGVIVVESAEPAIVVNRF